MVTKNYILSPTEPLTVMEALMVAVCGMVVVFIMLAMLAAVIIVISKIVAAFEGKKAVDPGPAKKAAAPAAAPAPSAASAPAPAPAPVAVSAPIIANNVPVQDKGILVAIMMAAIAEESGMPMNSFRITDVAPVAAAPVVAAPVDAKPAAAPAATAPAAGETAVNSPMPGNVFKVECQVGQAVRAGDVLVVLEAMKMEIEVSAPVDGTVKAVVATVGSAVNTDDLLVTIG